MEACFARPKRFGSGFTHVPYMLFATPAKLSKSAADFSDSPLHHPSQVPIWCQSRSGFHAPSSALFSALAHHRLTTQVPHAVDVALPSHAQVPKVDGVPLRVFWYPEPSFRAGVDVIRVDDVSVRIYSPEKTIADCFKYRNKIGLDVAIEALRAYRERTLKPNRAALTKFAQINRVQKIMRPYLEAVL